jgi:hypothetical protein
MAKAEAEPLASKELGNTGGVGADAAPAADAAASAIRTIGRLQERAIGLARD